MSARSYLRISTWTTPLRRDGSPWGKVTLFALAGAAFLAAGLAAEALGGCPIVKRIWTPAWTMYSAAFTFWMLAAFYWVIDLKGYQAWSFPLVVVGVNSIAMYCMSQLMKGWVKNSLKIHLDWSWNWLTSREALAGDRRRSSSAIFPVSRPPEPSSNPRTS